LRERGLPEGVIHLFVIRCVTGAAVAVIPCHGLPMLLRAEDFCSMSGEGAACGWIAAR